MRYLYRFESIFDTHCLLHHSAPIWTVLTRAIDGSRMITLGFGRVFHVKFLSIAEPTPSSFKVCQPLASSEWVNVVVDVNFIGNLFRPLLIAYRTPDSWYNWLQKRKTAFSAVFCIVGDIKKRRSIFIREWFSGPVPNSLWGRDAPLTVSFLIPCTKRIIIFILGPNASWKICTINGAN